MLIHPCSTCKIAYNKVQTQQLHLKSRQPSRHQEPTLGIFKLYNDDHGRHLPIMRILKNKESSSISALPDQTSSNAAPEAGMPCLCMSSNGYPSSSDSYQGQIFELQV